MGVIESYRPVKKYNDRFLVFAGSPATNDPEGDAALNEMRRAASEDPGIFIFQFPPFSDMEINALQGDRGNRSEVPQRGLRPYGHL